MEGVAQIATYNLQETLIIVLPSLLLLCMVYFRALGDGYMFSFLTHHYESKSSSPCGTPDVTIRAGGGITLSHHYALSNSPVFREMVLKRIREKKLELRIEMLQEMIKKYEERDQ